jgi:DNA-binding transcriptional ArsR family regulator
LLKQIENKIKTAVQEKNEKALADEVYHLKRLYFKHAVHLNRDILQELNSLMVHLLAWFYHGGSPREKELEKFATVWETLLDLGETFVESHSMPELFLEVAGSKLDQEIIKRLVKGGVLQPSDIANLLEKRGNHINNRLKVLEDKGVILRERVGKNSFCRLTPKGKKLAETREFLLLEADEIIISPNDFLADTNLTAGQKEFSARIAKDGTWTDFADAKHN